MVFSRQFKKSLHSSSRYRHRIACIFSGIAGHRKTQNYKQKQFPTALLHSVTRATIETGRKTKFNTPSDPKRLTSWRRGMPKMDVKLYSTERIRIKHFPRRTQRQGAKRRSSSSTRQREQTRHHLLLTLVSTRRLLW